MCVSGEVGKARRKEDEGIGRGSSEEREGREKGEGEIEKKEKKEKAKRKEKRIFDGNYYSHSTEVLFDRRCKIQLDLR